MLRLGFFLVMFFSTTLPFVGTLWVLDRLHLPGRRWLAPRYYRMLCRLLKIKIHVIGAPANGGPALIVGNHVSYLDIPVISTLGPVAFVAKQEIASWPIVGPAARLTGCVFVDRNRRQQTGEGSAQIARQLLKGDPIVLFAEGTSTDGNRVLAFRSALIGAVAQLDPAHQVLVQPLAISYNRLQGLPMSRRERPLVAWYGDLDFKPHVAQFVRRGVVDVTLTFGEPMPLMNGADRKAITRTLEADVRHRMVAALRHRSPEPRMAT